ncbi:MULTISPECIES: hypothetical protein [Streptomyces]|uniref:Ribbon-helix-helix protein, CopG family n=1 Tax=Streptomyces dengpaensis TaxID=2049881 RepID=A0ABM6SYK0_9ACTN|nr:MULTISPECIES: hypothetical protein [Streptomyces]AVH59713.1 hypothetical protein C4B68_32615 [Streptomyces dengpaensis]PIB09357.1 hypothetical protein B1C81_09295 [Streptomyces sp. HG99]
MSSKPRALSVRTTDELLEDLAVLQGSGMTASDAVRFAVRLLAQAHRYADHPAQTHGGQRPAVLSIRTRDLFPVAPVSDGAEKGV